MAERGIEEPLEGVDKEGKHLLLNGFMRGKRGQVWTLDIDKVRRFLILSNHGKTGTSRY